MAKTMPVIASIKDEGVISQSQHGRHDKSSKKTQLKNVKPGRSARADGKKENWPIEVKLPI